MAQLVVGAVGAAIGFAVGGPTGAYYGWAIGTTIGGIAFAPKLPGTEGPRLNDLKAQKSNYGIPIPIVYGAMRAAGNVIWATDVIETATTEEVGGKGGGGQEQTTYTYSQSFAVGLCEGEIIGIRRIWANGRLIYNVSDTADNATIIASNNAAAGMRFYNGSETQMPDSLIQAHVGAANTPAFRGLAYVVFEGLQLADYGNRAPNLEFEIVSAGSETSSFGLISTANSLLPSLSYGSKSMVVSNGYLYAIHSGTAPGKIEIYEILGGEITPISIFTTSLSSIVYSKILAKGNYIFVTGHISSASLVAIDISDPVNPVEISILTNVAYNQTLQCIDGDYAFITGWHTLTGGYSIDVINISNPYAMFRQSIIKTDYQSYGISDLVIYGDYAFATSFQDRIDCYNVSDKNNIYHINFITVPVGSGGYSYVHGCVISESNLIVVHGDGRISVVDISNPESMVQIVDKTGISLGTAVNDVVINGDYIYTISRYSGLVSAIDISDIYNINVFASYGIYTSNTSSGLAFDGGYLLASYQYEAKYRKLLLRTDITSNSPTLSAITADVCSRVGLTAGDINVSELTDLVPGYTVQRGTARSWLEQLMQAYYFDAVESDGKIKFVKRGGASVISIPEDDLAAHEYGSSPPDTLVTTRRQEMELPVEVAVQYMDVDAAYAVGSQLSQRLTTDSDNKIGINLAISMSASKAKQISDVLMYDAWTSRTLFDAQTAWKYSYLEPTDIVTISKGGRTYTARITSEDAAAGIYNRSLVLEDSSIYTQSASAPSMPTPTDTVSLTPLTKLLLLDIPLLRDQDDGYGFYAAACGYGAGWRGAQAFKSNDGGSTWSSFGDPLISESSIGSTSTALGNFTGGNIFDEINSVTVVLMRGELSSDTEINILNGSNVALIGNEIVQFKTATLTAADTYQLSGLLRGRRGTEWAMTNHAVGDRFVLLSASTTYLFYGPSSEFDVLRKYKGVSFGNYLANSTSQNFTHEAVALIPYAPVLLGGGRNAALDVVLNWTRRTRIAGGWNNYSDVPIGEISEAYEVEIYDSTYTTLKRTITGITTNTTTYTAAQQVTDFSSTQSVVYFKVYQISAIVGRGYESRGIA